MNRSSLSADPQEIRGQDSTKIFLFFFIEPLSKLVFFIQAIFKNPDYIRVYEFRRVRKVDF